MRDGQTKEQQPHSMQSKMWYSCVLPKFLARENQYISKGCSSCGQACAQEPQRMQGISGALGGNKRSECAIRQLVALTTGTSACGTRKPIIGPPMMMPSVSGCGVASLSSSSIGVPIRTS